MRRRLCSGLRRGAPAPCMTSRLATCLLEEMLRPWGMLKKFCYRGSVHDLSFKATLRRFPISEDRVMEFINPIIIPLQDIGVYVLPIERGTGLSLRG